MNTMPKTGGTLWALALVLLTIALSVHAGNEDPLLTAGSNTGAGSDDPQSVALENWRAVMAQNPPQEAGCFRESYPSLVRERVDCHAGPPQGVHPVHRTPTDNAPEVVGNGKDYAA